MGRLIGDWEWERAHTVRLVKQTGCGMAESKPGALTLTPVGAAGLPPEPTS